MVWIARLEWGGGGYFTRFSNDFYLPLWRLEDGGRQTVIYTTEYTQSGNDRLLAYIPSWWKNQPWLVKVHSIYRHLQSCSVRSSWKGRYTLHTPYFISTLYERCGLDSQCIVHCQKSIVPMSRVNFQPESTRSPVFSIQGPVSNADIQKSSIQCIISRSPVSSV